MAGEPGSDRKGKSKGFSSFREKLAAEGRLPKLHRRRRSHLEPAHEPRERPNVLWLMADQLRAETFGFMGHPAVETPNLDRLAEEGAVFTRMLCAEPVCMPSRASMLTGRYPFAHGVIANGYSMNPDMTVLPSLFRSAGYRTADIGKNHCGRSGREVWEEQYSIEDRFGATKPSKVPFDPENFPGVTFVGNRVCDNSDRVLYGKYPAPKSLTKSYLLATEAQKWLYWDEDERPFFLRVSFDDPHPPVVPPEPFCQMYTPEDVPPEIWENQRESMEGKPPTVREYQRYRHNDEISLEDHKQHAAHYFGLVSHLDQQMGRIVDYLKEVGRAENTLIVVNSDHGHMIGEHGLAHKGPYFYRGVAHIPTLLWWPGRIEPRRIDALAEGADLMPTLMELMGLDIPDGLDGRSLAPLLNGRAEGLRDYAFTQWQDYAFCIQGERWKLTWYDSDGEGELYDLQEDPWEKNNLFHEPGLSDIRDGLLERLRAWRGRHADRADLSVT